MKKIILFLDFIKNIFFKKMLQKINFSSIKLQ